MRLCLLALPFTRKSVGAISIGRLRVSESEPFAHDLELRVALPHQLVTRRWILGASQVSPDSRDDAHHVAQSRRRFQAFFLNRRAEPGVQCWRTELRGAVPESVGPGESSA